MQLWDGYCWVFSVWMFGFRKMKVVIKQLAADSKCDIHQTVLGIREGKEGWFHLYCPGGIACDDEGELWGIMVIHVHAHPLSHVHQHGRKVHITSVLKLICTCQTDLTQINKRFSHSCKINLVMVVRFKSSSKKVGLHAVVTDIPDGLWCPITNGTIVNPRIMWV